VRKILYDIQIQRIRKQNDMERDAKSTSKVRKQNKVVIREPQLTITISQTQI